MNILWMLNDNIVEIMAIITMNSLNFRINKIIRIEFKRENSFNLVDSLIL